MTTEELLLAFGRATLFTSGSAIVAWLLLRFARIDSPRIHRAVWLFVVAQGWPLFPWVWQIETAAGERGASSVRVESAPTVELQSSRPQSLVAQERVSGQTEWESCVTTFSAIWLLGIAALITSRTFRYVHFVRRVPSANGAVDSAWQLEWQRQLRAARVRPRVDLRATDDLGPLLCFVPFRYLVLVPRSLWSVLARGQRQAVLRHELAHLMRGDLWWALAIRAIALAQWFNPLVWQAVRRFDEAGEWACDDLVARGGRKRGLALAQTLLATVEHSTTVAPGTASIHGGELARRVRRLVSQRFKEETMAKKALVLVPLALVAALQLVRIEFVVAEEPAQSAVDAAGVAGTSPNDASTAGDWPPKYGGKPYVIEPPVVLAIDRVTPRGQKPNHRVNAETRKRMAATLQRSVGRWLVGPDGTIDMLENGRVHVAGETIDEARQAIEQGLASCGPFESVDVGVDIDTINSKQVYVILQGVGEGDFVLQAACLPETKVADVLESAVWPRPVDLKAAKIWVARPAPHGIGVEQILPVSRRDIADDDSTESNRPLLPNDRVFVEVPATTGSARKQQRPSRLHSKSNLASM